MNGSWKLGAVEVELDGTLFLGSQGPSGGLFLQLEALVIRWVVSIGRLHQTAFCAKGNLDQNIRYADLRGRFFFFLFKFLMGFYGSQCSCSRDEALYMDDGADQRISYQMVGILSGSSGVSCFTIAPICLDCQKLKIADYLGFLQMVAVKNMVSDNMHCAPGQLAGFGAECVRHSPNLDPSLGVDLQQVEGLNRALLNQEF